MFGFLTRLFGGKSTVIKDPDIGKVRYLESENGHVWAGTVLSSAAHPVVQFFIASKEMVLRHESKNAILDVLDNYQNHVLQVENIIMKDHPLLAGDDVVLQFLHIPEPDKNYDSEWICAIGERSFSVIFEDMKLQELILHED